MQGMDVFLMNMASSPEFAEALLRKIASLCKTLMGHFLEELGENVDIIKIGDDLGTQTSLMISPRMYRAVLKPIHADFIAFIKERTKAKVFFHTDGDVFDLVPDFIEIGVDILNPIQTAAGKMADLAELKQRYGDKLTFCGAIDTQRILPYGTPEEVRRGSPPGDRDPGAGRRVHGRPGPYHHGRGPAGEHPGDGGCRRGIWLPGEEANTLKVFKNL